MNVIQVPAAICAQKQLSKDEISFVNYTDKGSISRHRVLFEQFAFSFVQNSQKHIYRGANSTTLAAGQGMLIPEGNSIITEHGFDDSSYQSLVIFFPGELAKNILKKHLHNYKFTKNDATYIHFEADAYLQSYISHILYLIENGVQLSSAVAVHKIEELLLVILERYPAEILSLIGDQTSPSLKKIIEGNLLNNLTLEELAFLANRSLASFKRDFKKAYGKAPQSYIRERKLELALEDMRNGKAAAGLFLKYGYENLSNFNTAFKRKFGAPPSAYLLQQAI